MTHKILQLVPIILERYKLGISVKDISDEIKINIKTVRVVLRKNNIEIRGAKNCLLGSKFGRLFVISQAERDDKNEKLCWNCKCECGNYHIVRGNDLVTGKIRSCGCLHFETVRETGRRSKGIRKDLLYKGFGDLSGAYLSSVKRGALERELEYSVTSEFLWNLFLKQNKKCALTKLDITLIYEFRRKNSEEQTASLDRIDSSRGYTVDNVQWVHKDINTMKFDLKQEEFIFYCRKVVENFV